MVRPKKSKNQTFPISNSRAPDMSDPNPYLEWGEKGPER